MAKSSLPIPFRLYPRFAEYLIDAMAEGVFTLDAEGRITLWNPSMERITGYAPSEVLGKTCEILNFNRCFGKTCPANLKSCGIYERGRVDAKECLLRHKQGFDVPVLKNARVVRDDDGRVIGVVETLTDLTEIKLAQIKIEEANRRLNAVYQVGNIVGRSHAMQPVLQAIEAAAASDATVLIQGESGTGKELVAGAIHHSGPRARQPLVTVNCSALSETVLESELFGHVRGAFTGATGDRVGRFEAADSGTVFLDEIGEISPFIQLKLLRVLQEREIERVGEIRRRKVDIRVIAATHQDLYTLVKQGRFREDLYYRLKVFPIRLPPLKARREDIPLLIDHFIQDQNRKTGKNVLSLSPEALRMLMDYDWPGNVRELENAIEHAFVLCHPDRIQGVDLPLEVRTVNSPHAGRQPHGPLPPMARRGKRLDRNTLLLLLEDCNWNKAEVARRVGVSRTAIWKYMKKWNIPLNPQTVTMKQKGLQ